MAIDQVQHESETGKNMVNMVDVEALRKTFYGAVIPVQCYAETLQRFPVDTVEAGIAAR